jgi:hypothetical protein
MKVPDVSRAVEMLVTECSSRWFAKTVVETLFEYAETAARAKFKRCRRGQENMIVSSNNKYGSVKHCRIKKEGRQKAHAPHVAG